MVHFAVRTGAVQVLRAALLWMETPANEETETKAIFLGVELKEGFLVAECVVSAAARSPK